MDFFVSRSKVKGRTWATNSLEGANTQEDLSLTLAKSTNLKDDKCDEATSPIKTDSSKKSNKLVKAFSNYMLTNRDKISSNLPKGTTGREIRKELGRRWKMLSYEEKSSYCDVEFINKKQSEKVKNNVYCEYRISSGQVTQIFHEVEDEILKESFEVGVAIDYNKLYEIDFKDEFYNDDDYEY